MKRGVDYKGKVFLMLRGKKAKNERGKWEMPGGSVEFGERLEDAIKREEKEEHGVEIAIIDLLGVCDHLIPDEKQHWVASTFICTLISGEPKIIEPDKCEAIEWFSLSDAEKLPLSIVTKFGLEQLQKKYPQGIPNFYENS